MSQAINLAQISMGPNLRVVKEQVPFLSLPSHDVWEHWIRKFVQVCDVICVCLLLFWAQYLFTQFWLKPHQPGLNIWLAWNSGVQFIPQRAYAQDGILWQCLSLDVIQEQVNSVWPLEHRELLHRVFWLARSHGSKFLREWVIILS